MIEKGDKFSTYNCAEIEVLTINTHEVSLSLSSVCGDYAYFMADDIKELRKFLKKLQKQLEGANS